MNPWVKLIVAGLIVGIPVAGILMVLGWTQSQDAILYLSIGSGVVGGILFWIGLIGFLVTRSRRTARQQP